MSGLWANTSSSNPASPTTAQIPSTPSFKMKYQGKRVAQIVKLKPECVEEYKKCHAKVWPDVLVYLSYHSVLLEGAKDTGSLLEVI